MIRLALRVQRAQAEIVLAELLELAPAGVEERELEDGQVEYAVYGAPGELPALPDLKAAAGEALVEISTSETADDWEQRWRTFHRPVLVAGAGGKVPALYVRPPWEPPADRGSGRHEIVIDPGRAFGTGAHATTRLCLELLLGLASDGLAGGPAVDVGTGSGVLAIAAARLGFAPVLALDHDPESVRAARANASANGVEVAVERFDLRDGPVPAGRECVVLANLLLPLLQELAQAMGDPPRELIAGGLLAEQAEEAAAAFDRHLGLRVRSQARDGDWVALRLA